MNIRRSPEAESAQGAHIAEGTVGAAVIADLRVADGAGHLHPDMEGRFEVWQCSEGRVQYREKMATAFTLTLHFALYSSFWMKYRQTQTLLLCLPSYCDLLLSSLEGGRRRWQEGSPGGPETEGLCSLKTWSLFLEQPSPRVKIHYYYSSWEHVISIYNFSMDWKLEAYILQVKRLSICQLHNYLHLLTRHSFE